MGDRGGTATNSGEHYHAIELYPMGDRGGTATRIYGYNANGDYTRWEIGGEPQPVLVVPHAGVHYTRWEIGGEPQPWSMGVTGTTDYTRWEIGGEPQRSALDH